MFDRSFAIVGRFQPTDTTRVPTESEISALNDALESVGLRKYASINPEKPAEVIFGVADPKMPFRNNFLLAESIARVVTDPEVAPLNLQGSIDFIIHRNGGLNDGHQIIVQDGVTTHIKDDLNGNPVTTVVQITESSAPRHQV